MDSLLLPLLVLAALVLVTAARLQPRRRQGKLRLVRLVEGADLDALVAKFGSAEPLFLMHTLPGEADLVVGACFGTARSRTLRLRSDYLLVETRRVPGLALATHAWHVVRVAWTVIRHDLDVVHANSPYLVGLQGLAVARVTGRPLVLSIHADYEKSEALQAGVIPRLFGSLGASRALARFLLRRADRVLPIRESLAAWVRSEGVTSDRVRLFPHGLDFQRLDRERERGLRASLSVPDAAFLVSWVSRLECENYADEIPALVAALEKRGATQDMVWVVAGEGSLRAELERRTRDTHVPVHFLGAVPNARALGLRWEADVNLALMAGFSLIEACASGRPVIAYDVEWHAELVEDGTTGFLVPEHDVEAVAERTARLRADSALCRRLGASARRRAEARHGLAAVNRRKAKIYAELVAERSG